MLPRRKNPAQLDECAYRCAHGDKSHQRPLNRDEFGKLSLRARRAIEGSRRGRALICEHCHGVHLREPHANVPLGILDGAPGPGWHSFNFG